MISTSQAVLAAESVADARTAWVRPRWQAPMIRRPSGERGWPTLTPTSLNPSYDETRGCGMASG
jgi:hypothetical protein